MRVAKLTPDERAKLSLLEASYRAGEEALRELRSYKASLFQSHFGDPAHPFRRERNFDETGEYIIEE